MVHYNVKANNDFINLLYQNTLSHNASFVPRNKSTATPR